MNNFTKTLLLGLMLACLPATSACSARTGETASSNQEESLPPSAAGLDQVQLSITSPSTTHRFVVEVAQNGAEQAQGLMFRTELAPDKGMLFPFAEDRVASFWMKNTVIPLDIIFIRRDGTVESIAAHTVPYSLDPVRSGEPVAAVLEIAAGRAAELGISPGDIVTWPR